MEISCKDTLTYQQFLREAKVDELVLEQATIEMLKVAHAKLDT